MCSCQVTQRLSAVSGLKKTSHQAPSKLPAVYTLGDSVPFQRPSEFAAVRIAPLHPPPLGFGLRITAVILSSFLVCSDKKIINELPVLFVAVIISPAGNKEINKGLYSGTSSFAVGARSIRAKRAVSCACPVVRRLLYPINLSAEASSSDGYGDEPLTLQRSRSFGSFPPKDERTERGEEGPLCDQRLCI